MGYRLANTWSMFPRQLTSMGCCEPQSDETELGRFLLKQNVTEQKSSHDETMSVKLCLAVNPQMI